MSLPTTLVLHCTSFDPQGEVDRIEWNLQGGSDSDIDGDNDSTTSEEEDDRSPRKCYSTRTGGAATRLRLSYFCQLDSIHSKAVHFYVYHVFPLQMLTLVVILIC